MTNLAKKKGNEIDRPIAGKWVVDRYGSVYHVKSQEQNGHFALEQKRGDEWCSYGSIDPDRSDYIPIDSPDDLKNAYDEVTQHPDRFIEQENEEVENTTTTLATSAPLDQINLAKALLNSKINKIKLATLFTNKMKNELEGMVSALAKKVSKLQQIIDIIELYLGTKEQVSVLKSGASVPGPINLRQGILYMDEEYGDPRPNPKTGQKGIDFQSVEDFDKWLLLHIDQILPEKKGIIAMKPSRQDRSYSDNAWINAAIKENNEMTYLVIRNGENIYRIWTDIIFHRRLFPIQTEMEKLIEDLDKATFRSERERIMDKEYTYRRNAMIIQGLVDRTEIFQPIKRDLSLFKPETYTDGFNLIRDDENIIDDGRPTWKEWKEQINSTIGLGSRILFVEPTEIYHAYQSSKDFSYRYKIYSRHDNYPNLPSTGIYQIEVVEKGQRYSNSKIDYCYFLYNPGDKVYYSAGWEYDPHPRKNRVSFGILPKDDWVFNYDQISLDDIEYYLTTRKDKKDFIQYTVILWNLRDTLIAEHNKEKDFVKLVAGRLDVSEEKVWKAVDWWKFKNKWKRRIDSDDAKALRMIEKHLRQSQAQPEKEAEK